MKTTSYFLIGSLLLILSSFSYISSSKEDPMITRHDIDQADFFKLAERFEKYMCNINLPGCEGTIIADQWVLTAAHCAVIIPQKFRDGKKHFVIINDVEIEVDKVIMYKDWEESGADMALLHLKTPPIDAMQAKLYVDEDEVDKLIYMVGRGDKGDGLIGVNGNDGKQRGATNRVERATKNWLSWTFDHPDTKTKYLTEYEGISGPGDSGGPAFIVKNNTVYLAGVSSWQDTKGGDEGLYGVVENYTRVSQYINWINEEMAGNSAASEAILRAEPAPDAVAYVYDPQAISIKPSTLKQYVGEYKGTESTVKILTKENDTNLYLLTPENEEYEFIPTDKDIFSSKTIEGFSMKFETLENRFFKELTLFLPDGTSQKGIRK